MNYRIKTIKLACILLLTSSINGANAQFSQKSISFGLGPVYSLPPNIKAGLNSIAPGLCVDFNIGKNEKSKFGIQIQYAHFSTSNDTIYNYGYSASGFPKTYDLEGHSSQFSLGGTWQRYFRTEYKNQVFLELGGSVMWHSSIFSGKRLSSASGPVLEIETFLDRYPTFNGNIGGGMQQKLNEKFSFYEKVQLNYQIVQNINNQWYLTNKDIGDYFYLHFYIGCTYNFGK